MATDPNLTKRDDWRSPPEVISRVELIAPIGLDPCASPIKEFQFARRNIVLPDDGLVVDWRCPVGEVIYVNPPYGSRSRIIVEWIKKIIAEAAEGEEIYALFPAYTDTRWFGLVWDSANAICFWKGRIKHSHPTEAKVVHPSRHASVVTYWGQDRSKFFDAFGDVGELGRLNAPASRPSDDPRPAGVLGSDEQ